MMQRKILFCVFLLFLLQIGCGRPRTPDGLPKLHPVTIQLEQEGKPLADADVSLRSTGNTWSCGGFSNTDGIVTIHTHGQFSGAPLGKYKVVVLKSKSSDTPLDISGAKSFAEIKELEAKAAAERKGPGITTYLVDRKYSNPETTPLEIDIVAGKNTFKLDVGPAVNIVEKNAKGPGR